MCEIKLGIWCFVCDTDTQCFSLGLTTTGRVITGNVKLISDSVEQQQGGRPRQSASRLQPRKDGTE